MKHTASACCIDILQNRTPAVSSSKLHRSEVSPKWFTCIVHACSVAKLCLTISDFHGLQPSRLLCPWDFPGKNVGMGCHFLLQGIFPTQGLNPHLLHWQVGFLPLSHQGHPYLYSHLHQSPSNSDFSRTLKAFRGGCGEKETTFGMQISSLIVVENPLRHFPDDPVARSPHSPCGRSGFDAWSENEIPHAEIEDPVCPSEDPAQPNI